MSIAKTFGTLTLGAMGLMNAADATAQETKTSPKQEPAKVVKFITNEGSDATLVSKTTALELAGRTRIASDSESNSIQRKVSYSTTQPHKQSLSSEELEQRKAIYKEFEHVIPSDLKNDFMNRADSSLSNRGLRNFLYGIDLLKIIKNKPKTGEPGEVISDLQIRSLLSHTDLSDSGSIVFTVAKASKEGYKGQIQTNNDLRNNLVSLMNESKILNVSDPKFASNSRQ